MWVQMEIPALVEETYVAVQRGKVIGYGDEVVRTVKIRMEKCEEKARVRRKVANLQQRDCAGIVYVLVSADEGHSL